MAGDWLKMECSTPDKPEVLAITARLGMDDPDAVVGKLFRLWRWFDQHTTEGNATGVTAALLDRVIGVSGFCSALASVGWLHVSDDGITLPNFDKHNGNTAKNRALTAKRVASHKNKRSGNDKANAASVSETVASALPREEKRREEKEIHSEANASGAEAPPPSSADEIFGRGLPALIAAGCPEKNARSMLGLMRKTHGDDALIQALASMAKERPLEPVAWLQAALRPKTKGAGSHAGFASKNYRDGVTEDGSIAV